MARSLYDFFTNPAKRRFCVKSPNFGFLCHFAMRPACQPRKTVLQGICGVLQSKSFRASQIFIPLLLLGLLSTGEAHAMKLADLWQGMGDWFSRNESSAMQTVDDLAEQKSNAAIHPFLRGLEATTNVAGDKLIKPFAHSVWVQRAIKRVSDPISAVPLEFYQKDASGKGTLIQDDALMAFWQAPAVDRSGPMELADFIEATTGWLKMAGESFWLCDDTWLTQRYKGNRSPMIIARPDRMRPILDGNRLSGWEWRDANGQSHLLVPEQVIHRKFWNPYDDLRGMSEWEAAKVAGEADYLAGKFSLNMNRANGDRGVFVVAKGGMPTDEQREQITRALREKAQAARTGNYRPMFLTGDVTIEDPKVSSPDADFVASRLQNRHEVFIAFGVPPSMADIAASYSVGAASDRYMLISETCIPLANGKIAGGIGIVNRRFFAAPDASYAMFNFDNHQVMQEVRRERIKTGTDLWDRGMPWDQVSEHLDLGLPKFSGSDKAYVPFNVTEVDADGTPEKKPAASGNGSDKPEETETEDDFDKMIAALESRCLCHNPIVQLQQAFAMPVLQLDGGDDKRRKLADQHFAMRKPVIKAYGKKIGQQLMVARKQCLSKIEKHYTSSLAGSGAKAVAADLMFDLDDFTDGMTATLRKMAANTLQRAGDEFMDEVGYDDPFTMPSADAKKFLDSRENKIKDASQEIFDEVKNELQAGIDAGDSTAELADRVRSKFNEIGKGRAMTIASTEVGAAYGTARQKSMEQAGVQFKEWLTSGLPNVRAWHLEAEGQTVEVGEPFIIGGEALDHPGDIKGSAENVINCHCVSIASKGKES